ncbi:MAG: UDP-3-O-acyl-N-acetylglucosamine deacetylase [Alphaproteobacteria bacterium]|nr:UDP-3-O-acyl-N-acetylglucosamine deacetylase [Alphaproteobacteria bacterium]
MHTQHTLAHKVSCAGIGLHSGSQVNMVIHPAVAGTGILFKRLDVAVEKSLVAARFDAVCDTRLGTTITNAYGVTVSTIEHLMAAFWGVGIDNAIVELDGPEVPIMDGSSEPFVFLLECAGARELEAPRRILRVLKTVEVVDGQSVAAIRPNKDGDEGMVLDLEIEYNSDFIRRQSAKYDFRDVTFKQALSRARTFGFEHEVTALQQMGLALGGSLENAVVVGKDRILNEEGLRMSDEFIRHKALDCIGDLFLAGLRIDGHFSGVRPGHAINNRASTPLFAVGGACAGDVWLCELPGGRLCHGGFNA